MAPRPGPAPNEHLPERRAKAAADDPSGAHDPGHGRSERVGLATARAVLDEGGGVVLVDRDEARVRESARSLGAGDITVEAAGVDVTDAEAVDRLVGDVDARLGIDGLVNAAGVLQVGTIHDVSEAGWDLVLDTNLKGTYIACHAVIPVLERRGGGAIVNIASISGRTKSYFAAPNYVASKAGVIGLTMALAAQHAGQGIRVNCVAPGVIDTPMTGVYTDGQWQTILATIPLGRIGRASEVGEVIVALLSDRFSYVTGQTINVNGGQFML